MNALSLYTGVGGLDLAALGAGIDVVAMCEGDAYCRTVLRARFPDVPIYESDEEVTDDRLRADGIPSVDLVFGGPPCQPASAAGKRAGVRDPRWRWGEFLRIVREVRPRWVVAKQPPGIFSLDSGERWEEILDTVAQMGYRAGWSCYGADAVGAPQRRDRLFLVGARVALASGQ